MSGSQMLDAALDYAALGYPVFPLHMPLGGSKFCSCGNQDCPKPGKHPRTEHGFKDATTDRAVIEAWWAKWPDANIGLPTGQGTDLGVLDRDPRNGSEQSLAQLGDLPITPTSKTGGGGWHYVFQRSPECARSQNGFLRGFDFKSDGGYVVVPPSLHESGERYAWEIGLDETPIAPLPESVRRLLNGSRPNSSGGMPTSAPRARRQFEHGDIPEGTRNDTLFRLGCSLRAKGASEANILDELRGANAMRCRPPLADEEVIRIAASAARYDIPLNASGEVDFMKLNLTDKVFGHFVLRRHGRDMRHCHPWENWLVWDARRWKEDQEARAQQLATDTQVWLKRLIGEEIEKIAAEEAAETAAKAAETPEAAEPADASEGGDGPELVVIAPDADGDADEEPTRDQLKARLDFLWDQILKRESTAGRRNGLESASWEVGTPILPEALNNWPLLLNLRNGTLDLEKVEMREHRRDDLLTQIAPVAYDPNATCPRFETFLTEAVPEADVRAFLQRAFGYSMTGLVRDHVLFFLHGPGKNGKSTLLNAFAYVLGQDYAGPASPKLLVKRGREEHLTEIADLFGKRLVIVSESGEDAKLDEEKVKYMTGGDLLKARRMREDPWTFQPSHTFWLHSNYQPRIEGTDDGIWRRILHVPFRVQPRIVDDKLGLKLQAEAPGILNWGIQGLRDYLAMGLAAPDSVRLATAEYREKQDVVGRFLIECVEPAPEERVRADAMYQRYREWCGSNGESVRTSTWFGTRVTDAGLVKATSNGVVYLDVRLRK